MSSRPFAGMNRRQKSISLTSAVTLLVLCIAILATPQLRQAIHGPTPTEVALQREQARSADLKRKLDAATTELAKPRPIPSDPVAVARANDLAKQLAKAEKKLAKPRPPVVDKVAEARANDLAKQLNSAVSKLKAPRPKLVPIAVANMTKKQILAKKKVFGLYTAQSPFNYAEFDQVATAIDRRPNYSGYFQSWHDDFRPDAVEEAWLHGQVPLLTWESQDQIGSVTNHVPKYSLPKIIDGKYDTYLHRYAKAITKTGLPLIIRMDHEMNGTWYPWSEYNVHLGRSINGNHIGDYAKMWRHVHDIFQAEGANTYVSWLWAPNRINTIPLQPDPKAFYPGDKYVDIIGMSGYSRPNDPEASFAQTYGGVTGTNAAGHPYPDSLGKLRAVTTKKPILLAEIGASEDNGTKVAWINDLFNNLALPQNRDIIGFMWFNFSVTSTLDGQVNTNDWRITSSPSATRAMAAGVKAGGYGTDPKVALPKVRYRKIVTSRGR
jgi:mannan endo-1,4-beta-mannosidase